MTTRLDQHTVQPPEDPARAHDLRTLTAALDSGSQPEVIGQDGTRTALPAEILAVLRQVAGALSQGQAVTVAAHDTMLTTTQVAKVLGVSRQHVARLIDSGTLADTMVGAHHRVALSEVAEYQRRRALVRQLTQDAEDYDLGPEGETFPTG
ncbi:helix-turn-helix domain-containing protein [Kutzneria albida]|uniref:Helix-turn-helix domain-containing protein n=1 Tax=Kutzneria albida DSM 43870 TaxID=1449976 RepID=W5VYJ6_9PSEU|nr:helix-turn-helix domain-containing protein [Kutzneria albida]AHH93520.1 hypothetical protein KALB_143 [Kutzneria albida DSM 43870]